MIYTGKKECKMVPLCSWAELITFYTLMISPRPWTEVRLHRQPGRVWCNLFTITSTVKPDHASPVTFSEICLLPFVTSHIMQPQVAWVCGLFWFASERQLKGSVSMTIILWYSGWLKQTLSTKAPNQRHTYTGTTIRCVTLDSWGFETCWLVG